MNLENTAIEAVKNVLNLVSQRLIYFTANGFGKRDFNEDCSVLKILTVGP